MKFTLQYKYILSILSLILLIIALVTAIELKTFRTSIEDINLSQSRILTYNTFKQLEEKAKLSAQILSSKLEKPMYHNEKDEIISIIKFAKGQRDLIGIEIFDYRGVIIHDGTKDNSMLNTKINDELSKSILGLRSLIAKKVDNNLVIISPVKKNDLLLGGIKLKFSLEKIELELNTVDELLNEKLKEGSKQIIKSKIIIAITFSLIGIVFAYLIAHNLSKPIHDITSSLKKIGQGNYETSIPIKRTDELGYLVDSLNKMIEDLKQSTVSKDYMERIIDSMMDTLAVVDEQGKIVKVNNLMCYLLEYENDELVGQDIEIVLPNKNRLLTESKRCYFQESGQIDNHETCYKTKSGRLIHILLSISELLYTEDEEQNYVVLVARDITEFKKSEKLLKMRQFTIDNASEAICWICFDGSILDINDTFSKFIGFTKSELLEMNLADIDRHFSPDRWKSFCDGILIDKSTTIETEYQKKDGTQFPVEIIANLTEYEEAHLICLFLRDISARKKIAERIINAQKLESVSLLAGGIAHDFNNILTTALGNLSIIKLDEDLDDEVKGYLTSVEKALRNGQGLTYQLLTFAKGGAPIKRLVSLIGIVKETVTFSLTGSNIRCEFDIPKDIIQAEIDEAQISQVVSNITINAQQAMPNGGVIEVKIRNITVDGSNSYRLQKGNYAKIVIKDNGTGIPTENLPKIFDPYFSTKEGGHGLGLAASYSIIKKHYGHLAVKSESGTGTSFQILLPSSKFIAIQDTKETVIQKGNGHILVMDDEEQILALASKLLPMLGYSCDFSKNGTDAINCYKNAITAGNEYDALIMDLTIQGGMGGKEAAQLLIKEFPETKIIVSSGYSNDPILANFKDYGFCDILVKPYQLCDLGEVLKRVI